MKKGFTLAEVLITLAIIGVVAAITIPVIVMNSREQANITAFKKAVSVLNSAIGLSTAQDMKGPSSTADPDSSANNLIKQLTNKMNVIASGLDNDRCTPESLPASGTAVDSGCYFTTADGFQYILPVVNSIQGTSDGQSIASVDKYESDVCIVNDEETEASDRDDCEKNKEGTWHEAGEVISATAAYSHCNTSTPCYLVIDVNGANKPNKLSNYLDSENGSITDRFVIKVTDDDAMPAGKQAQAVMGK